MSFLVSVGVHGTPFPCFPLRSLVHPSDSILCARDYPRVCLLHWQENSNLNYLYFFRHFDKDKTGYLDHQEFKSCLRSLGYDLSIVEEGEEDPEFQAILRTVDPNG